MPTLIVTWRRRPPIAVAPERSALSSWASPPAGEQLGHVVAEELSLVGFARGGQGLLELGEGILASLRVREVRGEHEQLGAGLLVSGSERRNARALAYLMPLFYVSIALCAKAWLDGISGRPYGWIKTKRSTDETPFRAVELLVQALRSVR